LCSSGRTSDRSGQAEHRPEKRVIWPRTSSTASPTMPGQGCPRLPVGSARTWLQQQYYSERCRNHHHRGAAYPGRTQESPRGCRGPTGQKLCLPKAGVPPRTSRRDFPIYAGSLGPHRAHAGRNACSPGSPRPRAPPPRPSSPPRREGAPRLPPRRGGRYDNGEDRSPSPEPPGPQAFNRAIRRVPFPTRFRTPTTITKYSGETRPELWLADYWLAC
jgi:hypothetical protein